MLLSHVYKYKVAWRYITAFAILCLCMGSYTLFDVKSEGRRVANNTKLSKHRQAYVHQRDNVCYNDYKTGHDMHEVSDDFLSFGYEPLDWFWQGNLMLLRQLLHKIALTHPETRRTIHLHINFCLEREHSLVLPGGTNIPPNSPIGKVPSMYQDGSYYTVVSAICRLPQHDIVIQYSMPNIQNFIRSDKFSAALLGKLIYVPPIEYEYNPYHLDRDITPITTFVRPHLSRRHNIIQGLEAKGIRVKNHNNIASSDQMKAVYDASAVLLNIHQTPHHHTLEELRILPALLRGVVVISETAPLTETVPYSEFIVWSSIDQLPATITEVLANYEAYFDRFFGTKSKLPCILAAMRSKAYRDLENAVLKLHRQ